MFEIYSCPFCLLASFVGILVDWSWVWGLTSSESLPMFVDSLLSCTWLLFFCNLWLLYVFLHKVVLKNCEAGFSDYSLCRGRSWQVHGLTSRLWRDCLKGLELALVQDDLSGVMKEVLGVVIQGGCLVGEPEALLMKTKTFDSLHFLQNKRFLFFFRLC